MSSYLFLCAFSGVFFFSGVRQVILSLFTGKKSNMTFGLLAFLWVFYEYNKVGLFASNNLEECRRYLMRLWLILCVGEFLLVIFVSLYTNIFSKFIFVVFVIFVMNFFLNLYLPYGILNNRFVGLYFKHNIYTERLAVQNDLTILFSLFYYVYLATNLIFIFYILHKYYERYKNRKASILLIGFVFKMLLIFCTSFLCFHSLVSYLFEFTCIALILVIDVCLFMDVKDLELIKLKALKEKELVLYKNNIVNSVVVGSRDSINQLYNSVIIDSDKDVIDIVRFNSSKLFNSVTTILDVYRYNEKGIELSRSIIDLNRIVDNIKGGIAPLLSVRNICLESNIDNNCLVDVDVDLIEKVFLNILFTAINYLNTSSTILLHTNVENDKMLIVRLSSNNLNVSHDRIKLFWEKLVDGSYNDDFSSSYNLLFCKTVITAHDGNIGFDFDGNRVSIWFTFLSADADNTDIINNNAKLYKKVALNSNELNELYAYYDILNKTNFFEITKLRQIIHEIEKRKIVNDCWLFELSSSIAEMDQDRYSYLIDLIVSK